MLTLPAVRFLRVYDCVQHRMVNLWETLWTQEQIYNCPQAVELVVQAQTVGEALRNIEQQINDPETFARIIEAFQKVPIKSASFDLYGTYIPDSLK